MTSRVSRSWSVAAVLALCAAAAARFVTGWSIETPVAVAIVCFIASLEESRRWRCPAKALHDMIEGVSNGTISLEEMTQRWGSAAGELGILARDLHDATRRYRESKLALALLEKELRDRVANRTNALERQLSTTRIQASKDPLTGLFNRRMLEETLPELFEKCRTRGVDLTVLAIDVDRFKPLNDTLGHAAGDEFLKSIGQVLRSGVRTDDVPIRVGGDEFLILLPTCGIGPAKALAGRLAAMVDGIARTLGMPNPPSLSIGAATLTKLPPGATSQQLLEAADKDLYAVKTTRKRAA